MLLCTALVSFEETITALAPEGGKKSRGKAFRIPGLGRKDKEPDSVDLAMTETPNSQLEVDDEGFIIRSDSTQNDILPLHRDLQAGNSSTAGRSEDSDGTTLRDAEQEGLQRSTPSPDISRLCSTPSACDSLFGPPLEMAFRSKKFDGREQFRDHSAFAAVEYTAISSDSSSPDNVEDTGLDSPSHQTLGPSPEPGWAAWPPAPHSKDQIRGHSTDPFLSAFRDLSPAGSPRFHGNRAWSAPSTCPTHVPPESEQTFVHFPTPDIQSAVWNCKHIPPENHFLVFETSANQETFSDSWKRPPPPRSTANQETQGDPFAAVNSKIHFSNLPTCASSTTLSHRKKQDRRRDSSASPPVTPEDPFAITMIGSPTHQLSTELITPLSSTPNNNRQGAAHACIAVSTLKKEHWNLARNPFSDNIPAAVVVSGSRAQENGGGGSGHKELGERRKHRTPDSEPRRNAPPLTRHSGPQEDLCFSTDRDQDCLDISQPCSLGSHKGSRHKYRQVTSEGVADASGRTVRAKRTPGRLSGAEKSRSLCSSPLPEPSASLTSSSSSSPNEWPLLREEEWGPANPAHSPGPVSPLPQQHHNQPQRRLHLSRGPSPISLSSQEAWPVAAAFTEYINAYFKGGQSNRCMVKITGDLTMSFPAGITRVFGSHSNGPVLSFRLVNISRIDHFLPNQKLLFRFADSCACACVRA
uniref:Muniscin C-terminal domain-containing protein n=1 Tax=Knipowitschia caucasica TaxID=637954 RepID=A0AAV2L168_KNICA